MLGAQERRHYRQARRKGVDWPPARERLETHKGSKRHRSSDINPKSNTDPPQENQPNPSTLRFAVSVAGASFPDLGLIFLSVHMQRDTDRTRFHF